MATDLHLSDRWMLSSRHRSPDGRNCMRSPISPERPSCEPASVRHQVRRARLTSVGAAGSPDVCSGSRRERDRGVRRPHDFVQIESYEISIQALGGKARVTFYRSVNGLVNYDRRTQLGAGPSGSRTFGHCLLADSMITMIRHRRRVSQRF
jgi:hypothetical protein